MAKKEILKRKCPRCGRKAKKLNKWKAFHFCSKCCVEAEDEVRKGTTPMQRAFLPQTKGLSI
jgi:hypothetical protein